MDTISLGAGCFWGVEHAFKQLKGVTNTRVGYQGGSNENPTYKEICTKETGHAEVVEITYDPSIVSLERILDAFWFMHDPTQLNRQGPDTGSQYRSVIFVTNEEQRKSAQNSIEKLDSSGKFPTKIVTTIEEGPFWNAEIAHQDYLDNNPGGYCHIGLDVFQKIKSDNF